MRSSNYEYIVLDSRRESAHMLSLSVSPSPALLIALTNHTHQYTVQTDPFLTRCSKQTAAEILEAVKASITLREPTTSAVVQFIEPADLRGDSAVEGMEAAAVEFERLLQRSGVEGRAARHAFNDLHWKMLAVPPRSSNILSFGCGGGLELLALRARCKPAQISAIDWIASVSDEVLKNSRASFEACEILKKISNLEMQHDLVFSNHVLEHMFNIDEVLRHLHNALKPGGYLVSAMPLDATSKDLFVNDLLKAQREPSRIRHLNLPYFDLGHPWKSNWSDLYESLSRVGFVDIMLYQQHNKRTRFLEGGDEALASFRRSARSRVKARNTVTAAVTSITRETGTVLRPIFALERRLNISPNTVKNWQTEEVLISARRAG